MKFIQQSFNLFTFFFLLILTSLIFSSCLDRGSSLPQNQNDLKKMAIGYLTAPGLPCFKVYKAISSKEQKSGLSFFRDQDFSDQEGMIFIFSQIDDRQFWMPSTYFNIDLFFLTADFYVLDTHRNLKAYPSHEPRHLVPRSKKSRAQNVLELKSNSSLAQKIYPGLKLELCTPSQAD